MLTNDILKTQLKGLSIRAMKRAEAERSGSNQLEFLPEDILPKINDNLRDTIMRLAKMAQSIGPRIVQTIKFGTIGNVNWGGEATDVDPMLETLDLEQLADDLLEAGLYSGLFEGIVRRTDTDELVIEPLLGFTEPIRDKENPTQDIGFVHAWLDSSSDTPKWIVRVYDFETNALYEERGLSEPHKFKLENANVIEPTLEFPDGAPLPRFVQVDKGRNNQPLGHIAKLLPLIRSDWASQVRGDRAEEATAFPQLVTKGQVRRSDGQRSPSHVIKVEEDGDAHFLEPGNLGQIHAHHDRKLQRVREDGFMPGGFLGSQVPSGEALREANAKYIAFCKFLAKRLSRLLTQLVQDYARAMSLETKVSVSVQVNREFEMQAEIDRVITLLDARLVDFAAAVRAISVYVPNWSSEEVEEFILREQAIRLEREVLPEEIGNVITQT
jgi:hypothetical protein